MHCHVRGYLNGMDFLSKYSGVKMYKQEYKIVVCGLPLLPEG